MNECVCVCVYVYAHNGYMAAGGAMLYLEEQGLDVEAAIEFVMASAANETLVADQMLNYRSWCSYMCVYVCIHVRRMRRWWRIRC